MRVSMARQCVADRGTGLSSPCSSPPIEPMLPGKGVGAAELGADDGEGAGPAARFAERRVDKPGIGQPHDMIGHFLG